MRKNPREDYEDNNTTWINFLIYERRFGKILEEVIEVIWFFNRYKKTSNSLIIKKNSDDSFKISEINESKNIISSINIAASMNDNDIITIYTKLERSKKWEIYNIIDLNVDFSWEQSEIHVQHILTALIQEYFPNFYRTEDWRNFERIQEENRREYEEFLRRKKNPKKKKVAKKSKRRLCR